MGIMTALCARAFGVCKVLAIDIRASRFEFAKQCGIDGTYLIDADNSSTKGARMVAHEIMQQMGAPADIPIECSGVE